MLLLIDAFRGMWPEIKVDIIKVSTESGRPRDITVFTGLTAWKSQKEIKEMVGPFSEIASKIVDVFYIGQKNGALPEILEEYQVRYNGDDLKILKTVDQGGRGEMLEITAERPR